MWATIAMVAGGTLIVGIAIALAVAEAKERAKAETRAASATRALRQRERMDEIISKGVGRRRKLLDFLRRNTDEKERNR